METNCNTPLYASNQKLSPYGGGGGGRRITLIIIHCSAVKPNQTSSATQIDAWHKARGWRKIGYHFVIRRSGLIEWVRWQDEIGAHCFDAETEYQDI